MQKVPKKEFFNFKYIKINIYYIFHNIGVLSFQLTFIFFPHLVLITNSRVGVRSSS